MASRFLAGFGLLMTVAVTLAAAPAAPNDKAYPIKFERAFKSGQTFTVNIDDITKTTQKTALPDGTSQQSETLTQLAIVGDLAITAVDNEGRETAYTLTITRFTKQSNKEPATKLLNPGTRVTAKVDIATGTTFTIDTGPLSDEAGAALRQMFKPRKVNDDARLGTDQPRRVGESWPVRVEDMAEEMTKQGIDPKKISGTVTLRGVKALSGIECAQIETRVTIKDLPVFGTAQAKESTLTSISVTDLPTDLALPRLGHAVKSVTHLVATAAENSKIEHTVDSERNVVSVWTPKK